MPYKNLLKQAHRFEKLSQDPMYGVAYDIVEKAKRITDIKTISRNPSIDDKVEVYLEVVHQLVLNAIEKNSYSHHEGGALSFLVREMSQAVYDDYRSEAHGDMSNGPETVRLASKKKTTKVAQLNLDSIAESIVESSKIRAEKDCAALSGHQVSYEEVRVAFYTLVVERMKQASEGMDREVKVRFLDLVKGFAESARQELEQDYR